MTRRSRTSTLFPYTTLFRSQLRLRREDRRHRRARQIRRELQAEGAGLQFPLLPRDAERRARRARGDRKSTRLNSSHANISYAVFCLKKKKGHKERPAKESIE